ncbi:MAG TPA: LptE family protein [Flavobacteriaceae bacterium]|nr:LptE family protein [Flavobacteriaceae bacterium]
MALKKQFKITTFCLAFIVSIASVSCGVYSFSGANVGEAETFQVNYFQNTALQVEPGIDRQFTLALQDLIQSQTSLGLTNSGGDLIYAGEIVDYYIAPMTATAQSTAAQNRLTIAVNVRFFNTLDPEKDFEKRFSFYYDYDGSALLTGAQLDTALDVIFTRITQDVFNASLSDW